MLIPFNRSWRERLPDGYVTTHQPLFEEFNIKPTGVLHVGASEGQEAEVYDSLGIKKMVFIEAIPDVFLKLKQHISKYPHAIALNACISDVDDQKVKFNVASNDGQSSSMLEFGTHSVEHPNVTFVDQIECTTTRLDTLFDTELVDLSNGLDFLNIDLQGCELLALKGMGDLLKQFKWAYLEVNQKELYKGCALVDEVDQYMSNFGFTRVKTRWTDHGWGDSLYIKS